MKNSKKTFSLSLILSLLCLVGGLACAPSPETSTTDESVAETAPQATASTPSSSSPAAGIVPPVPAGAGTGASGLAWDVPAEWTEETPSSPMRRAQYRVPGAAGDAECVVFYFGPGQGGDAQSNIARWAGQFSLEDGQPATEQARFAEFDVDGLPVTMVEVAGTYSGGMPMQPAAPQPGYALLGAIVEGPDANWFYKMTGPEETVVGATEAFRAMIDSMTVGE